MIVNTALINSIREKFITEYKANSSFYYKADFNKIKSEQWPIERFVLIHKTEDASLQALIKAMKWRKEFGVLDRTDTDFPQEIYQTLEAFSYGKDREGRDLMMGIGKYHFKSELSPLFKQYWVHMLEKIDSKNKNGNWAVVVWAGGSGLSNMEINQAFFAVDVLQKYFPSGMAYELIVDMPWVFNASWKIIRNFMREELRDKVKLVDSMAVREYVDDDNIPQALGGKSKEPMLKIPPGVKPLDQMKDKLGLTDKLIERLRTIFIDALKDNPV